MGCCTWWWILVCVSFDSVSTHTHTLREHQSSENGSQLLPYNCEVLSAPKIGILMKICHAVLSTLVISLWVPLSVSLSVWLPLPPFSPSTQTHCCTAVPVICRGFVDPKWYLKVRTVLRPTHIVFHIHKHPQYCQCCSISYLQLMCHLFWEFSI